MTDWGTWWALLALGAYHGINPGMGWLFAVALGLQEQRGMAVLRALPAIGLGHGLSIAAAVGIFLFIGSQIPTNVLRWIAGLALIGFGGYRLFRSRHPTWSRMRVGFWDLTLWSFLMASAHGAGLMLFPLFLAPRRLHADSHAPHDELSQTEPPATDVAASTPFRFDTPMEWAGAVAVHTGAHLLVAGLVAWLIYTRFGLGLLRQAWLNLDLLWAIALLTAGGLILVS